MAYSITTRDGITINDIPDGVAPDSPELKARVAAIRAGGGAAALEQPEPPAPPAPPETTAAGLAGAATRGISLPAAGALAGGAAGAMLGGVGAVPGAMAGAAAGSLAGMVGDPIVGAINSHFGTKYSMPTEAMEDLLTRLGVPDPRTAAERIVQVTAAGAGGAGGMVAGGKAVGMLSQVPRMQAIGKVLAEQPVAQIAAGAGSGLASQYVAEEGGGGGAQFLAGLGGGMGAATGLNILQATPRALRATQAAAAMPRNGAPPPAGGTVPPVPPVPPGPRMSVNQLAATAREAAGGAKRARSILAEETDINPNTLAAAQRLGIDEYLQPDHLTTSQAYRELAQAVKSVPGSQTRAMEMQGLERVGKRADDLIAEIGGTTDLSRMDAAVRARLDGTITDLGKQADRAYESLRANIPPRTRGPADNVIAFVTERARDLDGPENLSSLEKMVRSKLTPKTAEDGTVTYPTYALIDDVRRDVGAAARQSGPYGDADTGLAKRIYKLLDSDQEALADVAGQGAAYQAAKGLVRVRKSLEDEAIALFGKHLNQSMIPALETATKSLAKGDAQRIGKIMANVPKDMREHVAATALNVAFGRATANGNLNYNTYARWYEGLLENKQAYAAIMTNLPQSSRKRLSDLYRVSRGVANATRERITTGRIQSVQNELQGADTLLSNIYGVARRAAIGIPIEAGTSAAGIPGAGIASGLTAALTKGKPDALKAADELLSSPGFQQLAIEAATRAAPTPDMLRKVAFSKAFGDFARSAKLPLTRDGRMAWLQSAIQTVHSEARPAPDDSGAEE